MKYNILPLSIKYLISILSLFSRRQRKIAKISNIHSIRGRADNSLAQSGRKQATATKLGIYSTYSHEAQHTS